MLKFIFGRAACGKTYEVISRIESCVKHGERPVLLVPEQFSFESEKAILDRLGDENFQYVSVMSFSRLCDEIARKRGGICGKTLTDASKHILIQRAVKRVSGELQLWGKYSSSKGFADSILKTVDEFKLQSITPENLISAAENSLSIRLKAKLCDTAKIYSEYNCLVAENFIDPSDRLERLYYLLENDDYFISRPVFLDSFKGFTGQQFKIIDRILSKASEVTVSMTYDPQIEKKYGIFHNISMTCSKLEKIAENHGVFVDKSFVLKENYYTSSDMKQLEGLMLGEKTAMGTKAVNVTVCRAESIYDEAEFVARNIRKTVREDGAKYGDFVIIARDTAPYMQPLAVACEKNNVSCFIDGRLPLASMPVSTAVISAVEAAAGFSSENILRFLKSGINILSQEDISELENYVYVWNISGKGWTQRWDMNPDGFSQRRGKDYEKKLDYINAVRIKAITPLLKFKNSFCETAKDMTVAIIRLLEDCNASKAFSELSDKASERGDFNLSDSIRSSWDVMMSLLNDIVLSLPKGRISVLEYTEALKTSLSFSTVGIIPQMADEAAFGAADRIRPSRPKYAFIMGANRGVFPKESICDGIFALNERRELIDMGLDITDRALETAIDEDYLVYSNVCCASKKVFISYSAVLPDKSEGRPSQFLKEITDNLDCVSVCEPMPLSEDNLPETEKSVFSEFCRRIGNESERQILSECLDSGFGTAADALKTGYRAENARISIDSAKKLFGSEIYMSPTKFDDFSHCRFKYFCRYGLKATKLYPAEFSAMQRGTLIHYVLERIITENGKDLSLLDESEIKRRVDAFTEEYLDSIPGYRSVETPRFTYLVSNIRRLLYFVVKQIAAEFARSDFIPVRCELKIGDGEEVPAIDIPVEGFGKVYLTGTVDRVDTWNGYVRVIDYKSGRKTFKLPDILLGQNMQMLLYLYTLLKSKKYGDKPAGVLYMKAKRMSPSDKSARLTSGLLLSDGEVAAAMDRDNSGDYIPKYNSSKPSDSFISEEDFNEIFNFIGNKLKSTARTLFEGRIEADPTDGIESKACEYCDFSDVCRLEDKKHRTAAKMKTVQVMQEIEKENSKNGI